MSSARSGAVVGDAGVDPSVEGGAGSAKAVVPESASVSDESVDALGTGAEQADRMSAPPSAAIARPHERAIGLEGGAALKPKGGDALLIGECQSW